MAAVLRHQDQPGGDRGARPTLRDVRDLCEIYEVGEDTSAELMELARQAREPGW